MVFGIIAGAVLGVASSLFGAKGKHDAASAEQEGLRIRAQQSEKSADITATGTDIRVAQQERSAFKVLGGIRAAAGASGVKQSGSVLDIIRSSTAEAALDKGLITTQGAIDEGGFRAEAAEARVGVQAAGKKKTGSIIGGVLGVASSLLGSFGG